MPTLAFWIIVPVPPEDARLFSRVQEHKGFEAVYNKILSEVSQEQVGYGYELSLFLHFEGMLW